MARPLRIDYPGAWHHVMNRGARRQAIFLDDEDRQDFLTLVGALDERYGVAVNAFCLMGNHYHLLVQSRRGELSRGLRHLDGVHAQRFNRRHGFDGPLFRGRFKSRLVEEGDYLRHLVGYIHLNPEQAGLVKSAEQYRWSSYRSFLGPASLRPTWLDTLALELSGLTGPSELIDALDEGQRVPPLCDELPGPSVYGSAGFVAQHTSMISDADFEPASRYAVAERPTIADVVEAVSTVWRVPKKNLLQRRRGQSSEARVMAIGLSCELSGLTLADVAMAFGLAHERSASSRASRFRQLGAVPTFAQQERQVRQMLVSSRAAVGT